MMCNVGGRERTAGHYRRLLSEAGFDLTAQYELPLDVALLRASQLVPGNTSRQFYGDCDV